MRAMIRLLPGMQTHMSFKMMIASKTLMTFQTFKRFLTGVSAFVVLQDMLVSKGSETNFAGKGFVTCTGTTATAVIIHIVAAVTASAAIAGTGHLIRGRIGR